MLFEFPAMKHLNIVLILCWSNVINGKAIGHVIPQDSQLLLKTNGNIAELYNSVGNGGSWLQAMLVFSREDPTGVNANGTSRFETMIAPVAQATLRCPHEFVTLGEQCYHFSLNKATWHDARKTCLSLGSQLAHPMNAVENNLLANYLRNYHKGSGAWHIGGTDEDSEGEWVWAHSKSRIGFADWSIGRPDNRNNIEHCMCISEGRDWKWGDRPCNDALRYICQQ